MIVGLFRALSALPLPLLHALGVFAGWLVYGLSPTYRRRMKANAALAGMAPTQWRPSIAEAGKLVLELPYLWMRQTPITPKVHWEGLDLIEAAHANGRGIVFLTPHLGCFEVTAQAYAEVFGPLNGPITVLFRPARQRYLRDLVDRSRIRPGLETAPATLAGVRQMIRALRRGQAVGLLPDQVPPEGLGTWAPFFGRPAYTMTLAARLVQQTGAMPLLAWGERRPHGRGYVVHLQALEQPLTVQRPDQPDSHGDADALQAKCAAVVNRAMEALIRQCPGQYLWGYNRYKRPAQGGLRHQ